MAESGVEVGGPRTTGQSVLDACQFAFSQLCFESFWIRADPWNLGVKNLDFLMVHSAFCEYLRELRRASYLLDAKAD